VDPDAVIARRDEFLLHVGPATAELLLSLAVARGAQRIVELGTSYGYSTLFLAEAARRTGGRVSSYELSSEKQAYARAQLEDAGLAALVDWRQGDAVALLDDEPDGVDFVLIDLWKDLYVPCLDKLYPKLADQAMLVADNMLFPEMARPDAEAYRAAVRTKPGMQSVLLPVGAGIELSCLWRGDGG
jgi:predicted O-methyltransferase YrrM